MSFPERCDGDAVPVKSFSTDALAGRKRIAYWNEVVCNTFTPLTVDAPNTDFAGRMRWVDLAGTRLALAESSQAVVTHSRAHVGRCQDAYFMLHLQLSGRSLNQQTGRELLLSPGSLAFFDSTRPYKVAFNQPTSILVLRIPRVLMREYFPCPEALSLVPLAPSSPTNELTARFMRSLWETAARLENESSVRHVTHSLMSLIAGAYASTTGAKTQGSSHGAIVRIRLLEHIEANLHDPELTPAAVADMGGISIRYLHLLFQRSGESVRRYIQRRRLELAARALRDPLSAAKSISQVACERGFKSQSQFCRAFREHYGLTPSEYRGDPPPPSPQMFG